MPVNQLVQLRRGTASQWTSANPTLSAGEIGVETDTKKIKAGDGSTAWNSLSYVGGSGGGLSWQAVQTTGFTAVAGRGYPCNTTSAAFTVTLPASPSAGDLITLVDYAGTWDTNNLTISPNGNKLNGGTGNGTVSTERGAVNLVYVDSTQGWVSYASNLSTTIALQVPIEYLVVAGGASGGHSSLAGGGSAGGFRKGTYTASANQVFTATIGSGGASKTTTGSGNSGSQSSLTATLGFTSVNASGGGAGSGENGTASSGGSGGGGRANQSGAAGNSGGYTPAEGSAGGSGGTSSGGGGGGAGQVGGNGSGGTGGNGGNGSEWPTSSGTFYAGGGAGVGGSASGGSGGGGAGSTAGSPNTGGGGGGWTGAGAGSGAGGSGVVIIRYPDSYAAATSTTGSPTITVSGGYRTYTFTGNGTITF
jgi:hypothetical protein